jgi:21S rRNA (GM2251-2'-O)-methyltransferase
MHRLYLCHNVQGDEGSTSSSNPKRVENRRKQLFELAELARRAKVKVDTNADIRLLNKLSENRPHNGVVLEASPAPTPPLLHFGTFDAASSQVPLILAEQSIEDAAANGKPEFLMVPQKSWRKPFVVMIDGITDPGNVGNIIRTCHFFGVDAVVVATNTCANVASPVLVKASSGAYESIPIFLLPQPSNFLYDSARHGWKIYGAMPPNAASTSGDGKRSKKAVTSNELVTASPLVEDACILVIGSEGEGLRANLQNRCSNFVSIERCVTEDDAAVPVGVDSINVATATGILTQAFLSKPQGATDRVVPHFTDNFLFTPGDESNSGLHPESVLYETQPVLDDTVDPVLEESGEEPAVDSVLDESGEAPAVDPVLDESPETAAVDPALDESSKAPAVEEEVIDGQTKDVAQ